LVQGREEVEDFWREREEIQVRRATSSAVFQGAVVYLLRVMVEEIRRIMILVHRPFVVVMVVDGVVAVELVPTPLHRSR
jgi:hypothetical protein